jgi:hypothetical protein
VRFRVRQVEAVSMFGTMNTVLAVQCVCCSHSTSVQSQHLPSTISILIYRLLLDNSMSKPGFQLLALSPPPWTEHLPALPSPPRTPAFSKGLLDAYSLSTHIFPAAYPRTTPPVPVPSVPSPDLPFKERKAGLNKAVAETLALRADYEADKLPQDGDARPLWICVNRYTRRKSKTTGKGITLVLSHSNGFMKEVRPPLCARHPQIHAHRLTTLVLGTSFGQAAQHHLNHPRDLVP